ncbi:MAG: hypothetical protein ABW205_13450 [Burkholderiales bacterium]
MPKIVQNDNVRRYTLILVIAVLTACAAPKRSSPPPAVPPDPAPVLVEPPRPELKPEPLPSEPQPSELDRVLLHFESVRRMQAPEAARELEQARQSFSRARTDYNRVQFALLSLLPNTGGRDDAKSIALLEPMLKDSPRDKSGAGSGLRAFAVLLYNQITEERKLEDRMKEEQKRADALQQKLDALKEVEKSLLDREQSQTKKK